MLANLILTLPFTVWVLTTFMRELPRELEEAAFVDGASPWVVVRRVFLPLMWPALVTTGLLAFIAAWNEFLFALTFTLSNEQRTVPVAIALITVWAAIAASYLYNWPVGFFVGTLAALSYGAGRTWAAWRRWLGATVLRQPGPSRP